MCINYQDSFIRSICSPVKLNWLNDNVCVYCWQRCHVFVFPSDSVEGKRNSCAVVDKWFTCVRLLFDPNLLSFVFPLNLHLGGITTNFNKLRLSSEIPLSTFFFFFDLDEFISQLLLFILVIGSSLRPNTFPCCRSWCVDSSWFPNKFHQLDDESAGFWFFWFLIFDFWFLIFDFWFLIFALNYYYANISKT